MSCHLRDRIAVGLLLLTAGPALVAGQADPWTAPDGGPTPAARQARALLASASIEGLQSAAYGTDDLTDAMSRYLRDVHVGRVDPRSIGLRFALPADDHDFRALVVQAAAANRLTELVADYRPPYQQYQRLVAALARYRAAARAHTAMPPPDMVLPVRPGDSSRGIPWIRERLTAVGDLSTAAGTSATDRYDERLMIAVTRFQRRHGLEPDAIVGSRTMAVLRVPLSHRASQLELALERLRWLPHQRHQRLLVINIPMFQLWAWDGSPRTHDPVFETGVIVGRALSTQTPVMAESLRDVVFRPYWNVPQSIVQNEIRPAVAADPDYLVEQEMELVEGDSDASPVVDGTPENLERLWRAEIRVRQRPGPRNALGLVKFVFPNDENVYMHGTPAQSLFSRARRDFSHGCVRVQDPVGLAEWVLAPEGGWTSDRIRQAMGEGRGRSVSLAEPIDVLLFYTTAVAMPDGTIRFAEDIYHHDAPLQRMLAPATP